MDGWYKILTPHLYIVHVHQLNSHLYCMESLCEKGNINGTEKYTQNIPLYLHSNNQNDFKQCQTDH